LSSLWALCGAAFYFKTTLVLLAWLRQTVSRRCGGFTATNIAALINPKSPNVAS
jgi:hypothetical protein